MSNKTKWLCEFPITPSNRVSSRRRIWWLAIDFSVFAVIHLVFGIVTHQALGWPWWKGLSLGAFAVSSLIILGFAQNTTGWTQSIYVTGLTVLSTGIFGVLGVGQKGNIGLGIMLLGISLSQTFSKSSAGTLWWLLAKGSKKRPK